MNEQNKPIPLAEITLTNGNVKAITPMYDPFVNYTFEKEKNWEMAKIISNVIYKDYISKNPNTNLTEVEGKIDKVTTQYEYFKVDDNGKLISKPNAQDVSIESSLDLNGNLTRQQDFQEWQINLTPKNPVDVRSLNYMGLSVSRGKENQGVKVQHLWLLAKGAEKNELLNGESIASYSLKEEKNNSTYPNSPNLVFVNLKQLAKEQTKAGELANILLGITQTSTYPDLRLVINNFKETANEFAIEKGVKKMLTAYEKAQETSWSEGLEQGREEGLEQGRKEGREEGLEEGLEKGREIEKTITAKNFLNEGVPIEVISKATGLTLEQIEMLGK